MQLKSKNERESQLLYFCLLRNGESLPVGVPTNSSPINGEGRGCDISPRSASLDRLNYVSNDEHSSEVRMRQMTPSPEGSHRTPLKPTGKEAELAAALKKSRRRSGSSPGSTGRPIHMLPFVTIIIFGQILTSIYHI